jgi:hypothetical protein
MTAPDTPTNPPLRLRAGRHMLTPDPAIHWTTLDTILTIATTIAVTAALIAVAAGWGLAL